MNRQEAATRRNAVIRWGTNAQHGLLGPSESSALADKANNAWLAVLRVIDDMEYARFDANDNPLPPATQADLDQAVARAEAAEAAAGLQSPPAPCHTARGNPAEAGAAGGAGSGPSGPGGQHIPTPPEWARSRTMKVQYKLSEAAQKRIGIATGSIPATNQEQHFDLASATPEERAAILSAPTTRVSADGHVDMRIVTPGYDQWHHADLSLNDNNLTLAQVAEHARRMTAEFAAARLAHYTELIAGKTAEYREALADEQDWEPGYISTAEEKAIAELGLGLAEFRAAVQAYREARPIWQARKAAEKAVRDAAEEEDKTQAALKAQAERTAMITWADQHGSDYLRRALAAGHDCSRMYWIERGAVEYPDYVLDYERNLATRSRSCPSLAGLDERDAVLALHPGAKVEIEWITSPPRDRKPDEYEEFEECEGVVVDDPLYKHFLVRLM